MSRPPAPLPPDLPAVFLFGELHEHGLPGKRARSQDVLRVGHGVYARTDLAGPSWSALGRPDPPHGRSPAELHALLRRRPEAVLSHETAAHLHGLPTPAHPWLRRHPDGTVRERVPPVHLSLPPGTRRVRREGVMDHRRRLPEESLTWIHGLRTTAPERTWLDLCALGAPWTLEHLVAAGDHAVRHPWTPAGRAAPSATPASLQRALDAAGSFTGVVRARAALELVRVGADSPAETWLRLALVDAGLGEPALQVPIDPADPSSPVADLAYPELRLALQYDGAHHRTPEQQARDARRERYCLERAWLPVRVTAADRREGFRSVAETVRRRRESL